jgi:hypothetical protein
MGRTALQHVAIGDDAHSVGESHELQGTVDSVRAADQRKIGAVPLSVLHCQQHELHSGRVHERQAA